MRSVELRDAAARSLSRLAIGGALAGAAAIAGLILARHRIGALIRRRRKATPPVDAS